MAEHATEDHDLSGELGLWMAVTLDAVETLRTGRGTRELAQAWIYDPGNEFFEAMAEACGYSPEGMRERIREAVGMKKDNGRGVVRSCQHLGPCNPIVPHP